MLDTVFIFFIFFSVGTRPWGLYMVRQYSLNTLFSLRADLEQHGDELFIVDISITILISKDHHLLSLHVSQLVTKGLKNMSQVYTMIESKDTTLFCLLVPHFFLIVFYFLGIELQIDYLKMVIEIITKYIV